MSRGVSVLRNSVVDTGIGRDVLRIVLGQPLSTRWRESGASSSSNTKMDTGERVDDEEIKCSVGVVPFVEGGYFLYGEDRRRRVLGAGLSVVCRAASPVRRWAAAGQ